MLFPLAVGSVLLLVCSATQPDRLLLSPNSSVSSQQKAYMTLEGIFNYYWKSDPSAANVKFLFVCGQIGGVGKLHEETACTCDHPKSCVNCYRWFDAVTLESIASYGIYMNTKNHSDVAETIFDHSPYNGDWNATAYCTFIDDFSWYGIAYLKVYEWLKVTLMLFLSTWMIIY